MADTTTDNFALVKPEPGSSGWDVKRNNHLDALDSDLLDLLVMAQLTVIDKDLVAPPGAPADRDIYIVAASATGAWAGHDGEIAVWSENAAAWAMLIPANGWEARLLDEGSTYRHDGSNWVIVEELNTKTINIGDWNMDDFASASVGIAHGLDLGKIRTIKVMIRNDNGLTQTEIYSTGSASEAWWFTGLVAGEITLSRELGGSFDSVDYDSTSYNRGWVTIGYID